MTIHFINNASVNLLHIVTSSGADTIQTMRLTIAQTILFIGICTIGIILVGYMFNIFQRLF